MLEIVSFTIIVCVASLPSYVNLIFCVPFTGTSPSGEVFVNVAESILAVVSLVVTPSLDWVKLTLLPLFLVASKVNPVKSILSPWIYSTLLIDVFTSRDSTGSFTVISKEVSISPYFIVTFGSFTSAGFPEDILTFSSVILISSVEPSSYVTVIVPPAKSIVSPWVYVVLVGFDFTETVDTVFDAVAKPFEPITEISLLTFNAEAFL